VVVPKIYSTHGTPGAYLSAVLDHVGTSKAVGVFSYEDPDTASASPFSGRLHCARPLAVIASAAGVGTSPGDRRHSGCTCERARPRATPSSDSCRQRSWHQQGRIYQRRRSRWELSAAVARIAPDKDSAMYLSNTADNKFLSRVWRDVLVRMDCHPAGSDTMGSRRWRVC
jgi:hypothetical protein